MARTGYITSTFCTSVNTIYLQAQCSLHLNNSVGKSRAYGRDAVPAYFYIRLLVMCRLAYLQACSRYVCVCIVWWIPKSVPSVTE